jgi:membrane-bound serine protease (ClpP class)
MVSARKVITTASPALRIRRVVRAGLLALFGGMLALLASFGAPRAAAQGGVILLEVDGAIGPATAAYIESGLEEAATRGASLVVLRMDTPGGLDTSMREIIRSILESDIPVASYVGPSGARAASAGTYILYASHIAAMAPGTNLGAATPVSLGGGGLPFMPGMEEETGETEEADQTDEAAEEGNAEDGIVSGAAPETAMEAKVVNDAVAYIRSLAEMRGRNADWAESAVREAASLPASEALAENVIDVLASSVQDLLTQIDGRTVAVGETEVTLETEGLVPEAIAPDWRNNVLGVITNPNVAMILMMIGMYGLLLEFWNPGALYPGTIGAICLLIALYALAALPLNFAGLALIALGVALIIGEMFTPSVGILGIGGTIAVTLGAIFFIDTDSPQFQVSWSVIASIAFLTGAFSLLVAYLAATSFRRKVVTGQEEMVGLDGKVLDWNGTSGRVLVHSERWKAIADRPLVPGQRIRVVTMDGLTLKIEPHETQSA